MTYEIQFMNAARKQFKKLSYAICYDEILRFCQNY